MSGEPKKKPITRQNSKFYGVCSGRTIGIFTNWVQCKESVDYFHGSKHQKFKTLTETTRFLNANHITHQSIKVYEDNNGVLKSHSLEDYCRMHNKPIPEPIDPTTYTHKDEDSVKTVYIDGACLDNGQTNAAGGYGVFWGDNHPSNISERLPSEMFPATNNRAELYAAIKALQQACDEGLVELIVKSDSNYVIQGITSQLQTWKLDKSIEKRPNKDLWLVLDELNDALEVEWMHVKGHSKDPGNDAADKLANEGADKPIPTPSNADTDETINNKVRIENVTHNLTPDGAESETAPKGSTITKANTTDSEATPIKTTTVNNVSPPKTNTNGTNSEATPERRVPGANVEPLPFDNRQLPQKLKRSLSDPEISIKVNTNNCLVSSALPLNKCQTPHKHDKVQQCESTTQTDNDTDKRCHGWTQTEISHREMDTVWNIHKYTEGLYNVEKRMIEMIEKTNTENHSNQIHSLETERDSLKAENKRIEEELNKVKTNADEFENKIDNQRKELTRLHSQQQGREHPEAKLNCKIKELERICLVQKEQIKSTESLAIEKQALILQVETLTNQVAIKNKEMQQCENNCQELEKSLEVAKEDIIQWKLLAQSTDIAENQALHLQVQNLTSNAEMKDQELTNQKNAYEQLLVELTSTKEELRHWKLGTNEQSKSNETESAELSNNTVMFSGPRSELSNFFKCPYKCDFNIYARCFNTTEAAYQYRKATFYGDLITAEKLVQSKTGPEAKEISKGISCHQTWESTADIEAKHKQWQQAKIHEMEYIISAKANSCKHFRKALLDTGDKKLIENVPSSEFWGCGALGKGTNMMGSLLEKARKELPEVPPTKEQLPRQGKENQTRGEYVHHKETPTTISTTTPGHKILLLGNSHINDVRERGICPSADTLKVTAYSIQEARNYIQGNQIRQYDAIILHLVTNDVKTKNPNNITLDLEELVEQIIAKTPTTKIVLSLTPSRKDNSELNRVTQNINSTLQETMHKHTSVSICTHTNLPEPSDDNWRQYFTVDGVHLTESGTAVLASNIRHVTEYTLGMQTRRRHPREKRSHLNTRYPKDRDITGNQSRNIHENHTGTSYNDNQNARYSNDGNKIGNRSGNNRDNRRSAYNRHNEYNDNYYSPPRFQNRSTSHYRDANNEDQYHYQSYQEYKPHYPHYGGQYYTPRQVNGDDDYKYDNRNYHRLL